MEGAHSLINRVFWRTRNAGLDHLGEKAGLFVIQRNGHSTTPFSFHSTGYWGRLSRSSSLSSLPLPPRVGRARPGPGRMDPRGCFWPGAAEGLRGLSPPGKKRERYRDLEGER